MPTLAEIQLEHASILTRFKLNDSASSQVAYDDVGGLAIPIIGAPERALPSIVDADLSTCSRGTQTTNYWEAALNPWILTNGVCLECVVVKDPNGHNFNVFAAPGQFELKAENEQLSWTVVNTIKPHVIVAAAQLHGWPQHVVCNYDIAASLQTIYVDGALVASQALTGAVSAALTGSVTMLKASTAEIVGAMAQDIAIYGAPLSARQIKRHFETFRQLLPDPGHVRQFEQIGSET